MRIIFINFLQNYKTLFTIFNKISRCLERALITGTWNKEVLERMI